MKLEMLDIYLADKNIPDAEIARRLDLDAHTVKKWKMEWIAKLGTVKVEVEEKIIEHVEKREGMWQKVLNMLK